MQTVGNRGVLLVGHGTRDARGQDEFHTTTRQVQSLWTDGPVGPCFLELAAPTIAEGMAAVYAAGVRQLTVAPLLLFAAGHAKRDIPRAVTDAARGYGDMTVRYTSAVLDSHPALLWLSELRYRQALAGREPIPQRDTALVMIGRGSGDAEATQRMHAFARLRSQRTPVAALHVGFVAVQRPTLEEAIHSARATGCRRVVVQPHLLFQGELLDQVWRAATDAAITETQEVIVTPHLGPGWPLARAVVDCLRRGEFNDSDASITDGELSSCKKIEPSPLRVRNG